MTTRARLAVLASGGGSNLQALIDAHARGDLPAPVVLVISNNADAGALQRARAHGISALHISGRTHADPDEAILGALREHEVTAVVLAGYMKLLGVPVLRAFQGRVVNIHPGPLPRFGGKGMYGHHVHSAVLAAKVQHSGPVVFLVTEGYDEGPIIDRREVPVLPDDDVDRLAARVLAAEHDLYWRVIARHFCAGEGDR